MKKVVSFTLLTAIVMSLAACVEHDRTIVREQPVVEEQRTTTTVVHEP